MSIRFLKLSLASPECIRSWTERTLPNGKRVGKILKGDLIDYKNGLPIRDGLSCERIFGPMVSFTCTCGRFKCIETRGIHIVHDTLRSSRPILPDTSRQSSNLKAKQWGESLAPFPISSTNLEMGTSVNPLQNQVLKPMQKEVSHAKSSKPLKKLKPTFFSILQSLVYRQKKMIRFLENYYSDYESVYHLKEKNIFKNQNQIVPSFVLPFDKSYHRVLPNKSGFNLKQVWYNWKKKQRFKKYDGFYYIGNKKIVGFKTTSSRIQNLIKLLDEKQFQIYTKFWFDLKVNYNQFLYEKHVFLWVPHRLFKYQKVYQNLGVHPSFYRSIQIRGLSTKSPILPIIDGIKPSQKSFWKVYNSKRLKKETSNLSSLVKPTREIGEKRVLSLEPKDLIKLPRVFQRFIKLKKRLFGLVFQGKGVLNKPVLSEYLKITYLYIAKQWGEKTGLNCLNQKDMPPKYRFSFNELKQIISMDPKKKLLKHACLFQKQRLPGSALVSSYSWPEPKNSFGQVVFNENSLIIEKPGVLNHLKTEKIANIRLGSLKINSFDFKTGLLNRFSKRSVGLKKRNDNSTSRTKIFDTNKKLLKPVSIFNGLKKKPVKNTLLGENRLSSILNPLSNVEEKKNFSSLTSSRSELSQIHERFSIKNTNGRVSLNQDSSHHNEDVSKPYTGSNIKQNVRVYKFKNFPPEEIRYCPYCEVELLPNSIRRYRLGYIEFVSPVTHIWYTATSIPLLLNLSKTVIEGIASCHEALSSGFPPVYKWSYNGESPTSWTFQTQPLKLPLNIVPQISASNFGAKKKSSFQETILKSYTITYPISPMVSIQTKPWNKTQKHQQYIKVWTPCLRILPRELAWENDFTIYKNRVKIPFLKTSKLYNTEIINWGSHEINGRSKKRELSNNNNFQFLSSQSHSKSENLDLTDSLALVDNRFWFNQENTGNETVKRFPMEFSSSVSSWKDVSYLFKCLWMFEYHSGKFLPKNNCFVPVSNSAYRFQESQISPNKDMESLSRWWKPNQVLPPITNSFEKQKTNTLHSKLKTVKTTLFQDDLLINLNPQNNDSLLNETNLPLTESFYTNQQKWPHTPEILKQFGEPLDHKIFLLKQLVKYTGSLSPVSLKYFPFKGGQAGLVASKFKTRLSHGYNIFNFSDRLFLTRKKRVFQVSAWFISRQKTIKTFMNNQPNIRFKIPNEIRQGFLFLNQSPKKVHPQYDPFTATEYEKKREWLKLEGFFEDPSNKKSSNTFQKPDSLAVPPSKIESQTDKKHLKSWNETDKKETDYDSLDNWSLPLVLPFLGKNPDNIEFQSNYSNHEHFHIDPLRFIIDFFTTQHVWGYNNVDSFQDYQTLETNKINDFERFMDKKPYTNIWTNHKLTYLNPLNGLKNKLNWNSTVETNILNRNQNFKRLSGRAKMPWTGLSLETYFAAYISKDYKILKAKQRGRLLDNRGTQPKNHFIYNPHSLKRLQWDFSLFSVFEMNQRESTNSKNPFLPLLNRVYQLGNHVPSKACPFLPVDFQVFNSNDLKNEQELDSKRVWFSSEFGSNNANFNNQRMETNYQNWYETSFRKVGRKWYYFKLEQMARSENGFLKNLFFRNYCYKTLIFKTSYLVFPFKKPSIFYSESNNNQIKLEPKQKRPNVLIAKRTAFLFGLPLNRLAKSYQFDFNSFEPKMFWKPYQNFKSILPFLIKRDFSGLIKMGKSAYVNREEQTRVFARENFKNSLWPLKSKIKNSHQKLYTNNFDRALFENAKHIQTSWLDYKNTFKNNLFNGKNGYLRRLVPILQNTIDFQLSWLDAFTINTSLLEAKKPWFSKQTNLNATILKALAGRVPVNISFFDIKRLSFQFASVFFFGYKLLEKKAPVCLYLKTNMVQTLSNSDYGFDNKQASGVFINKPLEAKLSRDYTTISEIFRAERQPSLKFDTNGGKETKFQYLDETNNLRREYLKPLSIKIGLSVSTLYDFTISRSSFLNKNILSPENKRFENETLDIFGQTKRFKKWTQNQSFPAVYLSNLTRGKGLQNLWQKTYFLNSFHKEFFLNPDHKFSGSLKNDNQIICYHDNRHYFNQTSCLKIVLPSAYENSFRIMTSLNLKQSNKNRLAGRYQLFKSSSNKINLNSTDKTILNRLHHQYSFRSLPLFWQARNYPIQRTISISAKARGVSQKTGFLSLIGFETTQIEFFGSLKIYAKRRFFEIWDYTSQNFKNTDQWQGTSLNQLCNRLAPRLKSFNKGVAKNNRFAFLFLDRVENNKLSLLKKISLKRETLQRKKLFQANMPVLLNFGLETQPVTVKKMNSQTLNKVSNTFYNKAIKYFIYDLSFYFSARKAPSNKAYQAFSYNGLSEKTQCAFLFKIFLNTDRSFMVKSKKPKNSYLGIDPPRWIDGSVNKNFLVWLGLYQNQPKILILPWKKLQLINYRERSGIENIFTLKSKKEPLSFKIDSFCSSYSFNKSRLTPLIIEPQTSTNYKYLLKKREQNMLCSAYAMETIQHKTSTPKRVIPFKSVQNFEYELKHSTKILSLSSKINCFSYFGYNPIASLKTTWKSIKQPKEIKKIPPSIISKQIPLLIKKPVFSSKNLKLVNNIQLKHRSPMKSPKISGFSTLRQSQYQQISQWGRRGHLFDNLNPVEKTNNNKVSDPFNNLKYDHSKTTNLLFRTDQRNPNNKGNTSLSDHDNATSKGSFQKILSSSLVSVDKNSKNRVWTGNTNYYACISQITRWGSDHGSWILFLKYIRANIYKGDQLLPLYFNKMNFQMMPRTGGIMLQQLLSQLTLLPPSKALNQSSEPAFISKQKLDEEESISEMDTWQNAMANKTKNNQSAKFRSLRRSLPFQRSTKSSEHSNKATYEMIEEPNNYNQSEEENRDFMIRKVTSPYFNYNSNFFSSYTKRIVNFKKNLQFSLNNFFKVSRSIPIFNPKINTAQVFSINFGSACNYLTVKQGITCQRIGLLSNLWNSTRFNYELLASKFKQNVDHKYPGNTSYQNNHQLYAYAYKIKKPVSHKRFRQIYELNSSKSENNWYRLNNLFSYSPTTIYQRKTKNENYRIREKNLFHLNPNSTIRSGHLISKPDSFLNGFHSDHLISYNIPLVANDIRILKLIYSLIVSFQLHIFHKQASNKAVKKGTKPENPRSRHNQKLFKLLNGKNRSFNFTFNNYFSIPDSKIKIATNHCQSKIFGSKYSSDQRDKTNKLSNRYYHIYYHPNNNLKPESGKYSILGLSTKNALKISNGTNLALGYNSFLSNLSGLSSNSTTSRKLSHKELLANKPWFFSSPLFDSDLVNFKQNSKNFTNGVFKSNSTKMISQRNRSSLENFYFSSQKTKIYNLLISPLEVPKSNFSNFGFPITPVDFVGLVSNSNSLKNPKNKTENQKLQSLNSKASTDVSSQAKLWGETQKWFYRKPVNNLISDITPYHSGFSSFDFNQSDNLKQATNLIKSKKPLETGFQHALPINLETYQGQIQSEALFIKLKMVGNYNLLIKKKNTLFKTLIVKMNSSLRPLLFAGVNKNELLALQTNGSFIRKTKQGLVIDNTSFNKDGLLDSGYGNFNWSFTLGFKSQYTTVSKKQSRNKKKKNFQICALEFLKVWLFLDSAHGSPLNRVTSTRPTVGIYNTGNSQLIAENLSFSGMPKIRKSFSKNFFQKILQFYDYRKNFLLKKIFKQRINLTHSGICEPLISNQKLIKKFPPTENQYQYLASSSKNIVLFKSQPSVFEVLFRLPSQGKRVFTKSKPFKAYLETYRLLKRSINTFYDLDYELTMKYEFKPFGPQIKHNSSYSNWKNFLDSENKFSESLKSFKPQFFDLRDSVIKPTIKRRPVKNQTRFRLLTVPQIFDFKNQNDSLKRIRKNYTPTGGSQPVNSLGLQFFSSPRVKSSQKTIAFPVFSSLKKLPFWGTHSIFDYGFKKSSGIGLNIENFYGPIFSFKKLEFNENNCWPPSSQIDNRVSKQKTTNNDFINVFDEKEPTYSETFLNSNRPVSSKYTFREENLKVSSSYKALLRKAKILDDYVVPNPFPLNSKSTCLRLLNAGLPRSIWGSFQPTGLGFNFYKNKNTEANWEKSKSSIRQSYRPLSHFIWDANQSFFKNLTSSDNDLSSSSIYDNNITTNQDIFSIRDWTKIKNQTITKPNSNIQFFPKNESDSQKTDFSHNLKPSQNDRNNSFYSGFLSPVDEKFLATGQDLALTRKNTFRLPSDQFENSKSSRRSSNFNYGRNLRKLRLQYLRNFRRLRFIEYLKATYIKPEWMILSLLPVLPPDLRPVIANPRGYITGDINTHYQNVIYRNNNIEKLLDTFWIPRKFYSKMSFVNHQKNTTFMLSSRKSYFHSSDDLLNSKKRSLKLKNCYPVSKLFSKLTRFPLIFESENTIQNLKTPVEDNESQIQFPQIYFLTEKTKPLNKQVKVLESSTLKPTHQYVYKKQLGLAQNQKVKGVFSFLINRLSTGAVLSLNPIKFNEILRDNLSLNPYYEIATNQTPFLNTILHTKPKPLHWKLERMISPGLYKLTTTNQHEKISFNSGFLSPVSKLSETELSPNKITNSFPFSVPINETRFLEKTKGKPVLNRKNTVFESKIKKKMLSLKIQKTAKAILVSRKPWQKDLIQNNNNNTIDHTRNKFVTPKINGSKLNHRLAFGPTRKKKFYEIAKGTIDDDFELAKIKKPACFYYEPSGPYHSHYHYDDKPLAKLYNYKSFFGSNIGIATGYNEILQTLKAKALKNDASTLDPTSRVSIHLKNNSIPSLNLKLIRTQALHDAKPLQEMQYSLQKAVDALIDNSQKLQSNVLLRKGRPLKSLSDNLKGKEGRFRQHLLGKRVDYSGRSVIVVGPDLKLYECGIPLIMALRLFQPFLILYLIYRFKIASLLATQLIQRKHPMVINLLKKFIETWPILLNRAPTLHRMNIQAFKIKLVQGKAILLHPLVCSSYNADFDGDQMGVHVPITQQARAESWKLLWSINNSIAIASRQPLFLPSQDMVIGNYYLTAPPIENNSFSLMPKRQLPSGERESDVSSIHDINLFFGPNASTDNNIHPGISSEIVSIQKPVPRFSNFNQKFLSQNTSFFHESILFSPSSQKWSGGFSKMNHFFYSLEQAYQYYLNTAYRFHVNTPVWFRFNMVFETSEREKSIEITLDKHGNSIYTTKYYEKKLKRNRILGENAFYFVNNLAFSTTQHMLKNKNFNPETWKNSIPKPVTYKKLHFSSNLQINKSMVLLPETIFNKNLNPILLNQIIRSTFGRIEFYYEAFYGSSLQV